MVVGATIVRKVADFRFDGMLDSDEILSTLIAATFADALRKGISPRDVLDGLWAQLPTGDRWETFRPVLEAALDAHDQGVEAPPTA